MLPWQNGGKSKKEIVVDFFGLLYFIFLMFCFSFPLFLTQQSARPIARIKNVMAVSLKHYVRIHRCVFFCHSFALFSNIQLLVYSMQQQRRNVMKTNWWYWNAEIRYAKRMKRQLSSQKQNVLLKYIHSIFHWFFAIPLQPYLWNGLFWGLSESCCDNN